MELHKIFLVEDDQNFGGVLKSYLEMDDFEVTWIDDGLEAVSAFEAGKYSICILDIMLPNLDGFSIAKKIKEIQNSIPLIFLTAKTLREDVLHGYKIGADDYITKPFDSEVLIYKIKAILKRETNDYIKSTKFCESYINYNLVDFTGMTIYIVSSCYDLKYGNLDLL